jgi:hypothetical protein
MREITHTLIAADRGSWRGWLAAHGAEATEIWLLIAKKGTGVSTVG